MKKILLLFLCVFFISCASTPTVRYIGDAYYKDRGYFETSSPWIDDRSSIGFRTINGTDKVVAIAERSFDNIMTVSKTDEVLLRFADGKEIELSYNNRVSQYDTFHNDFRLIATSEVIEDFGTLEIVRMETDDGYLNIEVDKGQAEKLITRFNMIKAEATAKYGASE